MTLPELQYPTEAEIGGWLTHCNTNTGWSARAGSLSAARENLGLKGMAILLNKMGLDDAMDVVEWLRK